MRCETKDVNKRYEKCAQSRVTDSALGSDPFRWSFSVVRKTVLYSPAFAWTGPEVKPSTINIWKSEQGVSAKDYDKVRDQWKKEKEKSIKSARRT